MLHVIDCHFDEDPRDKIKQMNTVVHQKSHAMNVRKRMDNECSSDEDDREYSTNQLSRYRWTSPPDQIEVSGIYMNKLLITNI